MPDLDPSWSRLANAVAAQVAAELRADPPLLSPWLNSEQAATYLGLEPRGLETMRRRGDGPRFSRVGHRIVRYHVSALDTWLQENMK